MKDTEEKDLPFAQSRRYSINIDTASDWLRQREYNNRHKRFLMKCLNRDRLSRNNTNEEIKKSEIHCLPVK